MVKTIPPKWCYNRHYRPFSAAAPPLPVGLSIKLSENFQFLPKSLIVNICSYLRPQIVRQFPIFGKAADREHMFAFSAGKFSHMQGIKANYLHFIKVTFSGGGLLLFHHSHSLPVPTNKKGVFRLLLHEIQLPIHFQTYTFL